MTAFFYWMGSSASKLVTATDMSSLALVGIENPNDVEMVVGILGMNQS